MRTTLHVSILLFSFLSASVSTAEISDADVAKKADEVRTKCRKEMSDATAPIGARYKVEKIKAVGTNVQLTPEQLAKVDELRKKQEAEEKPIGDQYKVCLKKVDQIFSLMDKKPAERTWPAGI
jgi:hypothetical protein